MRKAALFRSGFASAVFALILSGCAYPHYIDVGDPDAPVWFDPENRRYQLEPYSGHRQIRYADFYLDWVPGDGFVIFPERNRPDEAFWNSRYEDRKQMHTFFAGVREYDPQMSARDIDTLLEYVRFRSQTPPGSKHRNLEVRIEKRLFCGLSAVYSRLRSYEAERDCYIGLAEPEAVMPPSGKSQYFPLFRLSDISPEKRKIKALRPLVPNESDWRSES